MNHIDVFLSRLREQLGDAAMPKTQTMADQAAGSVSSLRGLPPAGPPGGTSVFGQSAGGAVPGPTDPVVVRPSVLTLPGQGPN